MFRILLGTAIWKVLESDPVMKAALAGSGARRPHRQPVSRHRQGHQRRDGRVRRQDLMMSDIHCAVCGEPWDSYGARHGDMAPWEYRLFRQGAGCPCCEGNAPAEHIDEHLRSVVMNDEDPDSFALLHAPDATRPKWARPPDQVLFECAGCGARLERDIDLNNDAPADLAVSWRNVPAVNAFASRDWPVDASDSELQTIGGKRY